ncbi:MAG: hypothetical protein M3Q71_25585 [Chloroflexota bacterium]|nr:hypothetical protein [Chloroflexota bacterium]MDP9473990.1 hypothetical protein [Chloroflexota bacterium]
MLPSPLAVVRSIPAPPAPAPDPETGAVHAWPAALGALAVRIGRHVTGTEPRRRALTRRQRLLSSAKPKNG